MMSTLHFRKKNSVLFLLLFICFNSVYAQEITINQSNPSDNQVVGEDMYVLVEIDATFEISTVEASVNDNSVLLTPAGNSQFQGVLSLAGISQGLQTLEVTATDFFNNTATENIAIIFDTKPEINISLPLDHSVARPELEIVFDGSDVESDIPVDLSYKVDIISDNGNIIGGFDSDSPISTTFNLSDYLGEEIKMSLSVIDARGQQTSIMRQIYIDDTETLFEVYGVENEIMDFDGDELLFVERKADIVEALFKTDISTDEVTDIPIDTDIPLTDFNESYYLSDQGVIIEAGNSAILNYTRSFFWNKNTNITTEIGHTGIAEYDDENHIVQIYEDSIVDDDLLFSLFVCTYTEISPGTFLQECKEHYFIQKISDPTNISMLDGFNGQETYDGVEKIQSDSSILYYDNEGNIVLQNNGTNQFITTDGIEGILKNRDVKTDGSLFVYVKDYDGDNFSIALYDGVQELELRALSDQYFFGNYYKINNGNVAYNVKGNLDQEIIKLRKPSGEIVTVSPFGTNSFIEALNENGEIVFTTDGKRYLYTQEGELFAISKYNLGSPYYHNDQWYIAIGNTLYGIDMTVILSINNNEILAQDTITVFPNPTADNLTVHFHTKEINDNLPYFISNIMGQEVLKGSISTQDSNATKIDLSGLNSGVYFLTIKDGLNSIVKKVIKK